MSEPRWQRAAATRTKDRHTRTSSSHRESFPSRPITIWWPFASSRCSNRNVTIDSSSALRPLLEPCDQPVPRAEEPKPVEADDWEAKPPSKPTASEGPTPSRSPSCDEAMDPCGHEDSVGQGCCLDEENEWPVEWGSDTCSTWLIMLPL